jgi:hypothetical protein
MTQSLPFPNVVRDVAFLKVLPDGSVDETVISLGAVEIKQSELLMVVHELGDGTFRRIDTLEAWVPNESWRKVASRTMKNLGRYR